MPGKIATQFANAETVQKLPPLPLRRSTATAGPYPIKALGKTLGEAATAIMDKIGCPDAIAAQSVLGAAALATQAHVDLIHPATGELRPISLFLVTVAVSGERKSAADRLALGPIVQREAELSVRYEQDNHAYRNAAAIYDRAREVILKDKTNHAKDISKLLAALGPPPSPALSPLLTAPDPTLEGLHKHLATGEPSIGLFSDEGGTFIGGYGMSDESKLRTGSGLSDMWDGKPIRRVRGGDGVMFLKGRRLSLHIMAQPGVAETLLADPVLAQQGLLSRLLVSSPASLVGTRMQHKSKATTEPALKRYNDRLLQLLRQEQRRAGPGNPELSPRRIQLSSDAKARWIAFADRCEGELLEGQRLESIKGFGAKLAEHALRIAGVLQIVDDKKAIAINASVIDRAIIIALYYGNEALRLFEHGSSSIEIQRAEKVLKWLTDRWCKPTVALTHIYQTGPNSIRDAAKAREAVAILEQHHWLRPVLGGGVIDGKQYREVWEISR